MDEKVAPHVKGLPSRRRPQRERRGKHDGLFGFILLLVLSTSAAAFWAVGSHKNPLLFFGGNEKDYVGKVTWENCKNDAVPLAECGSITVPLDYFNSSSGTARLAMSRYPATNSPRKGMVLINPGGPGGSGKGFIFRLGPEVQAQIGEDYDVVGFDPRGIGESEPKTYCFSGDASYAQFVKNTVLSRSYDLASNASTQDVRQLLIAQQKEAEALYRTQFEICGKTMGDDLRYMGTSTVVRDIDFITKQLEGPDALINFYGFSYGTILGQYLVNMLPDRIGRVAIDGVADATAWASKPYYTWYRQWLTSTTDAYDIFLSRCAEVGPNKCPLAHEKGENPSKIKDRLESFIDGLFYEPMAVSDVDNPGLLTAGRVRIYLISVLTVPQIWPAASVALAQALAGNGAPLLRAVQPNPGADLARSAVSCNDNAPFETPDPGVVVDELLDVFHNVSRLAFTVVTTEPDAGCQFWPVTPPERFQGPWNHTLSNPILILSNTADPVTPLRSGELVKKLLGNSSSLLIQDSPGHCTIALPSLCTINVTRSFFADGTLPPPGTVCPIDHPPFSEELNLDDAADFMAAGATAEEAGWLVAQVKLGRALPSMRQGGLFDNVMP